MAGEETGFKSTLKEIGDKLQDISELNIRTYTGNIAGAVAGIPTTPGKPPTAKQVMDAVFQSGNLEVVGLTSMMLDGDIDQYISKAPEHKDLYAIHVDSVKVGQETRRAVFELFAGAVKKLIDQ